MKHCKHYLLFLLAGALLLLPVTSHYAITWEDIKKRARSFVSEDSTKIMPGAVIAVGLAAGGLYYWWMSKKGGDVNKDGINLKQLQVYSQGNWDGGGAASCGYQTLLRGMQIVRGKSGDESDVDLEKTLMDSASIGIYFGENGEWRKQIIARRKDQELKKLLHIKFVSTLIQDGDAKSKDLYRSALGFLEDLIVVISKNPAKNMYLYDFSDEAIQGYLAKSLAQLSNEGNKDLIVKLQQPDMINYYFNLEKMRKEYLVEEFFLSLPNLIAEINNNSDLREDFAGEWLSDGEIEYLWNEDKNNIVPEGVNCSFKAIANFELVGNQDIPKEFDEVAVYIDETIKPFLNKKQQMFQIFGLGTMRQTGEDSGTRGHWYPLVMHQNHNGERIYYITDSLGNRNRIRDTNAWKIINLIEEAAKQV